MNRKNFVRNTLYNLCMINYIYMDNKLIKTLKNNKKIDLLEISQMYNLDELVETINYIVEKDKIYDQIITEDESKENFFSLLSYVYLVLFTKKGPRRFEDLDKPIKYNLPKLSDLVYTKIMSL